LVVATISWIAGEFSGFSSGFLKFFTRFFDQNLFFCQIYIFIGCTLQFLWPCFDR
jgi:hypothetical protein